MNFHVVFAPAASEDLENLLIYLAARMGAERARLYVDEIQAYCLNFSTFPKRGMKRSDLRSGLRLVGYRRRATIAFEVTGDVVIIARIFYRGRNVELDDDAGDPA
jgi:plasmid stabilization system protein ParE